ncbi:MAG: cupin domain-containing protein, partial [Solirubrobacteraceae bacterium]
GSAGWGGDTVAHPTPRRQFFCTLAGRFALTTSDGETRAFGPGSLLLLEDTRGEGHLTKFLDASVVVAAIALAEPSAA